jgi:hypothetical protein
MPDSPRRTTVARDAPFAARPCSCGRLATTCRTCTATLWRSGNPGSTTLRGASIDSGHHVAEENPSELRTALIDFLNEPTARL